MAITQGIVHSFKTEVLGGIHDLDTDIIKIALFTGSANLAPATTTAYSTANESSGTGYTAGGKVLTGAAISIDGGVAIVDFDDAVWANATVSAAGALIYNSSKANRAIAILSFGGTKTSTDGDFSVLMPAPAAATAVIQLA